MPTVRYYVLRYFSIKSPISERRLQRKLRKLNISSEALRFARSVRPPE